MSFVFQFAAITRGDEGGAAGKATLTKICLILFIWAFVLFN